MNVELLFSVPTTWNDQRMMPLIKKLIKEAGFDGDPIHTSRIHLTESEATAVYASTDPYQKGEVVLVCDAGGGTADVDILKVNDSGIGRTILKPMILTAGVEASSAMINFQVRNLLTERFTRVKKYLPRSPNVLARQTIKHRGTFESSKCDFGSEVLRDITSYPLDIPDIEPSLP